MSTPKSEIPAQEAEISAEQSYISHLYERLDDLRSRTDERLKEVLIGPVVPNLQGPVEQNEFAAMHRGHASRLNSVEEGLCFGRIDFEEQKTEHELSDARLYIGRMSLLSETYDPLLVDWRAPAAERFYQATYADRMGVVRRRHIHTRGRKVTGLDDDVLDLESITAGERTQLMGEGALLASLETARTGRMADIVSTIQAEQDRIIRSGLHGILVVEGGPGTGKTVVALHRAAYLLYNHRKWLSKRGVLVLGPNATFVRYIDQVLPSLGETDVVMATIGELYPGITTGLVDRPEAAVVKGDLRMVDMVRNAIAERQWVPEDHLDIKTFDGHVYRLTKEICVKARQRARDTGLVHNRARATLIKAILDELTRQGIDAIGREFLPLFNPDSIRHELSGDDAVHRALAQLWPELTPHQVLADLYSDPEFLMAATPHLGDEERKSLLREDPRKWTVGDIPLLDELALLVGETDLTVYTAKTAAKHANTEAAEAEQYAQGVAEHLAEAETYEDEEKEIVSDAGLIARRYSERVASGSIADRALLDREWEFGYAIIDEAQELSAMAWRLVMRRVPGKSMTIVGDVAQTGAAEGATSWAEALGTFTDGMGDVGGQWRRERLSVNYRTPAEIMAVAADVLAATDPELMAPVSVREGAVPPWAWRIQSLDELLFAVRKEREEIVDGRIAVIAPESRLDEVASYLPDAAVGGDSKLLDADVAILSPAQSKGLEFDSVIVVDPDGIVGGSGRGSADLYVALTRATRRLGIVHENSLPEMLNRLVER